VPLGSFLGFLPYSSSSALLDVVQAVLVALPAAGLPVFLQQFAGRIWSLIMPVSIVVVVAGLAVLPGAAITLTWLALIAVPLLAAATLGWGMHGARPLWALAAVPLLAAAVAFEGETVGDVAALTLTALSCVALARLLSGVVGGAAAEREADDGASGRVSEAENGGARSGGADGLGGQTWVRAALVTMAVIDAILVFSSALQGPNATLNAAVPAEQLPRLQFVTFGGASMGYGDVFVAAVLGAVLAAEGAPRRVQLAAAAATFVAATVFSMLWWIDSITTLPATVPVAAVLLAFGGLRGWRAGRPDRKAHASVRPPAREGSGA
jgi:prepilin signal peptidase PulO-like enzyme (type II secretory pathway)